MEDGRKALSGCLDYLENLSDRIGSLTGSGASVEEMVRELFGGESPFHQHTKGQFSSANLVRGLLEV